ncbi:MAG: hypothetical protein ACKO85_01105 [Isosphaeraceae bacterium]
MATAVETQSARNALRHGLAGDKYLPAHAAGHFNQIKAGLVRIYQPATPESEALVEELAFCRWKIFEADRIFDLSRQAEMPMAADYYRRHLQARFQADLAAFEQSPGTMLDQLLLTLPGTRYILSIWHDAFELLQSGKMLTLPLISRLVAALGSRWNPSDISHENLIFSLKCVALSVQPLALVPFDDGSYANEQELMASRRVLRYESWTERQEEASADILAIATAKISELKARVEFLEQHEPAMIQAFAEMHAGFGLLDSALSRQASRVNRYRMQATHRAAFLEFRLIRLQDEKRKDVATSKNTRDFACAVPDSQNDFLKFVSQNQPLRSTTRVDETDHLATTTTTKAHPIPRQPAVVAEDTGELRNEPFITADEPADDAIETVPISQGQQKWMELAGWVDPGDQPMGRAV